MNLADIEKWFDDISARRPRLRSTPAIDFYKTDEATAWAAEAETAVASIFPPGHPVLAAFADAKAAVVRRGSGGLGLPAHFESIAGAFEAARKMVKDRRLHGLVEGIQATTVGELLDQAAALLEKKYTAAATVVAGGALETHLLHLCQRSGIASGPGSGSISKYNGAIGEARNKGATVYSATDGKLVEGWGGMRNDAAHSPATFNRSVDDVRLMLEGIRQFVARNP